MTTTSALYHNVNGLADLKRLANTDKSEAIAPVARQFESLFLQMMLKSMRDTVPEGGLLSGGDVDFYQDMMDSQLAVTLSEGGGVGLAAIIERQLGGQFGPVGVNDAERKPGTATAAGLSVQLRMQQSAGDDNDA